MPAATTSDKFTTQFSCGLWELGAAPTDVVVPPAHCKYERAAKSKRAAKGCVCSEAGSRKRRNGGIRGQDTSGEWVIYCVMHAHEEGHVKPDVQYHASPIRETLTAHPQNDGLREAQAIDTGENTNLVRITVTLTGGSTDVRGRSAAAITLELERTRMR